MVQPDRTQTTTIRHKQISCWTTKDTNIHSEYVIHIAFPRQQWLHGRVSMLYVRGATQKFGEFDHKKVSYRNS